MTKFLTELALHHRKLVYLLTAVLTIIFLGLTAQLKMNPDWKELLPKKNEVVANYIKVSENFSDITQLILTVTGDNPDEMRKKADEIAAKLKTITRKVNGEEIHVVKNVYHRMPMEFFENHSMMSMKSSDLKDMLIMLRDPNIIATLDGINTSLEKSYTGEGDSEKLNNDEQQLLATLQGMIDFFYILTDSAQKELSDERVEHAVDLISVGEPYFFSHDKSMLLIYVEMAHSLNDSMEMTYDATEIMNVMQAWDAETSKNDKDESKIEIGYTGMGAIGKDEMDTLSIFSLIFSFVAMIVIFLVLVLSFRQVMFPWRGGFVLFIGVIWALGMIYIFYHRLSMFTIICSFILIGLGIDFVIHIITRYTEERGFGNSIAESISSAINHTGPAVIVGGLTTTAAFFALVVSTMDGIVEFGVATGAGVFFQLLATFILLPSLLVTKELRTAKKMGISTEEALNLKSFKKTDETSSAQSARIHKLPRTDFPILGRIVFFLFKNPVSAIMIFIVLAGVTYVSFNEGMKTPTEYNFLNLEPEGLPSIELQHVIQDKFDQTSEITWVMADDLEEARAITDYYKSKVFIQEGEKIYKAAGYVDSASNFIQSPYEQAKAQILINDFRKDFDQTEIREIRAEDAEWLFSEKPANSSVIEYNNLADNLAQSSVIRSENAPHPAILKRLKDNFIELYSLSIQAGLDKLTNKLKTFGIGANDNKNTVFDKLNDKLKALYALNPDKFVEIFNKFNIKFFNGFKHRIIKMSNTDNVTVEMLPELLKNMYVSQIEDEKTKEVKTLYSIAIYSKKEIWEREPLESFVKAITNKPTNPLIIEEKKLKTLEKKQDNGDNPFGSEDDNPFGDNDDQSPFSEDIKKTDNDEISDVASNVRKIETLPTPTGTPQLMLIMIDETQREGTRAGLYALIVIFIILLVQFIVTVKFKGFVSILNALGYTLLAAVPLIMSLSWMIGLMYFFDMKFNYLNFIAFPVILGIGVDDGVHFVHRYRMEGNGSLKLVATSVGKAILLTTITTGIGFGMLISNPYRGLASFGSVATIGIVCCLLTTLFAVPAILRVKEFIQGYKGYKKS